MNAGWTAFWAAFVALGTGAELYAVHNRQRGDTLSEQFWAYATGVLHRNIHPKINPVAAWVFRIIVLVFGVWIGPHLAFGAWTT